MAAPPPIATLGGPAIAAPGTSELGLGMGAGMSLFDRAHAGGTGWTGRYRHGLSDALDLGVDVIGVQHADKGTLGGKLALRWAVAPRLRLELGAGAADDSEGKSVNYDLGIVTGTRNPGAPWNYYGALRIAGAHGFPGDVCCGAGATGTSAPPNSFLAIATLGTEARVSDNARFIFEAGAGPLWVHGRDEVGKAFYLGVGLLLNVGAQRP